MLEVSPPPFGKSRFTFFFIYPASAPLSKLHGLFIVRSVEKRAALFSYSAVITSLSDFISNGRVA